MGGRRRPHAAETQRAQGLREITLETGLRTLEDALPKEGSISEDRFRDAFGGFLSGPMGGRAAPRKPAATATSFDKALLRKIE